MEVTIVIFLQIKIKLKVALWTRNKTIKLYKLNNFLNFRFKTVIKLKKHQLQEFFHRMDKNLLINLSVHWRLLLILKILKINSKVVINKIWILIILIQRWKKMKFWNSQGLTKSLNKISMIQPIKLGLKWKYWIYKCPK